MKKSIVTILVLLILNFRAHAELPAAIGSYSTAESITGTTVVLIASTPLGILLFADNEGIEKFVNNLSSEEKIAIVSTKDEALFLSSTQDTDNSPSQNLLKAFAAVEKHLQGNSKERFSEYTTKQRSEIAFELSSFIETR